MDRLWTPWRYAYITGNKPEGRPGVPAELAGWPGTDRKCVFCNLIASVDWAISAGMARDEAERYGLVVSRYRHGYCCLNRFPYSSGHVLLVPYRHTDQLATLDRDESATLIWATQQVERALRAVYDPDGINLGMNLGKAAGAGVAGHIHLHALPRWVGDTSFVTVTAETRILPETLDVTWQRVRDALQPEATRTDEPAS